MTKSNIHLVLLGDSIFDNAAYVPDGPAVIDHVRNLLPDGSRAALIANDGDVVENAHEQLKRLPSDATHLALCIGGNDAIGASGLVDLPAMRVSDPLTQ